MTPTLRATNAVADFPESATASIACRSTGNPAELTGDIGGTAGTMQFAEALAKRASA